MRLVKLTGVSIILSLQVLNIDFEALQARREMVVHETARQANLKRRRFDYAVGQQSHLFFHISSPSNSFFLPFDSQQKREV